MEDERAEPTGTKSQKKMGEGKKDRHRRTACGIRTSGSAILRSAILTPLGVKVRNHRAVKSHQTCKQWKTELAAPLHLLCMGAAPCSFDEERGRWASTAAFGEKEEPDANAYQEAEDLVRPPATREESRHPGPSPTKSGFKLFGPTGENNKTRLWAQHHTSPTFLELFTRTLAQTIFARQAPLIAHRSRGADIAKPNGRLQTFASSALSEARSFPCGSNSGRSNKKQFTGSMDSFGKKDVKRLSWCASWRATKQEGRGDAHWIHSTTPRLHSPRPPRRPTPTPPSSTLHLRITISTTYFSQSSGTLVSISTQRMVSYNFDPPWETSWERGSCSLRSLSLVAGQTAGHQINGGSPDAQTAAVD